MINTSTERVRKHRERKYGVRVKTPPKSAVERMREYRERRRLLKVSQMLLNRSLNNTLSSDFPDSSIINPLKNESTEHNDNTTFDEQFQDNGGIIVAQNNFDLIDTPKHQPFILKCDHTYHKNPNKKHAINSKRKSRKRKNTLNTIGRETSTKDPLNCLGCLNINPGPYSLYNQNDNHDSFNYRNDDQYNRIIAAIEANKVRVKSGQVGSKQSTTEKKQPRTNEEVQVYGEGKKEMALKIKKIVQTKTEHNEGYIERTLMLPANRILLSGSINELCYNENVIVSLRDITDSSMREISLKTEGDINGDSSDEQVQNDSHLNVAELYLDSIDIDEHKPFVFDNVDGSHRNSDKDVGPDSQDSYKCITKNTLITAADSESLQSSTSNPLNLSGFLKVKPASYLFCNDSKNHDSSNDRNEEQNNCKLIAAQTDNARFEDFREGSNQCTIMIKRAKTAAERVREHRARKKGIKSEKPPPKSAAERTRAYRERKKLLTNNTLLLNQSSNELSNCLKSSRPNNSIVDKVDGDKDDSSLLNNEDNVHNSTEEYQTVERLFLEEFMFNHASIDYKSSDQDKRTEENLFNKEFMIINDSNRHENFDNREIIQDSHVSGDNYRLLMMKKKPKTVAERVREYRARKRGMMKEFEKVAPKTSTERSRACRARQRLVKSDAILVYPPVDESSNSKSSILDNFAVNKFEVDEDATFLLDNNRNHHDSTGVQLQDSDLNGAELNVHHQIVERLFTEEFMLNNVSNSHGNYDYSHNKEIVADSKVSSNKFTDMTVKKAPKSSAKRTREYRERKFGIKVKKSTVPKTPAERMREYRARKQGITNEFEKVASKTSTEFSRACRARQKLVKSDDILVYPPVAELSNSKSSILDNFAVNKFEVNEDAPFLLDNNKNYHDSTGQQLQDPDLNTAELNLQHQIVERLFTEEFILNNVSNCHRNDHYSDNKQIVADSKVNSDKSTDMTVKTAPKTSAKRTREYRERKFGIKVKKLTVPKTPAERMREYRARKSEINVKKSTVPKSNSERMREYRERKFGIKPKRTKVPKSPAERMREYRARQRLLKASTTLLD